MDLSGAVHGWSVHATENPLYISHNDETWHSYPLTKEDPNDIEITWGVPWVPLTSAFFTRNKPFSFYREVKIKIGLQYIIYNSFVFYSVFKGFFD